MKYVGCNLPFHGFSVVLTCFDLNGLDNLVPVKNNLDKDGDDFRISFIVSSKGLESPNFSWISSFFRCSLKALNPGWSLIRISSSCSISSLNSPFLKRSRLFINKSSLALPLRLVQSTTTRIESSKRCMPTLVLLKKANERCACVWPLTVNIIPSFFRYVCALSFLKAYIFTVIFSPSAINGDAVGNSFSRFCALLSSSLTLKPFKVVSKLLSAKPP